MSQNSPGVAAGGRRRSRTIYSACSPGGGDNLGCVAPPRARLTYGLQGTSENDGPGTTVTTPVSIAPGTALDPIFILCG